MRAFVAGATGTIGMRLVAQLGTRGRQVMAWSRNLDKVERPRAIRAER